LLLGGREEEREHDDRGATDRHRRRDVPEGDPVEQRLEVVERIGGNAAATDLSLAPRIVGVQAHERRHVERDRKAGLAMLGQEAVPGVRLRRRAVAGELAHRPEPAPVHRGVGAAGEREGARFSELLVRLPTVEVARPDDRRDRLTGQGSV
jgi:hypothetical protein